VDASDVIRCKIEGWFPISRNKFSILEYAHSLQRPEVDN
jgi:hypothetical protein